jgi:predicted dehydrogenase
MQLTQEIPHLIKDRRAFLAAGAFTIVKPDLVRGSTGEKLKAGVVGLGGRGRQAVVDFLTADANVEVTAAGDLFEDKLEQNLAWLKDAGRHPRTAERVKVGPEQRFTGFDAYQKVIASGVDIVMLCTPPGYRPMHFEAAVEAGKHVFCEKPFGTDPVGVRRFMEAARKSEEKKLTVVSGAQRRFQKEYVETVDKIRGGAIGELRSAYAYWVGTPVIQQPKGKDPKWSEMTWQHRNWYSNVWLCGDQIVEQHLHNLDVITWVMGTHPVKVVATGGVIWRPQDEVHGHIYDHITADFEYANGVRLSSYCRQFPKGLYTNVSEMVVGTKGKSNCRDLGEKDINPYVAEHVALVKSIRGEGPLVNHAMAVAESTMTCIMARESAYSGEAVTWEEIMASQLDLQPKEFGYDAKPPVAVLPVPGKYKRI